MSFLLQFLKTSFSIIIFLLGFYALNAQDSKNQTFNQKVATVVKARISNLQYLDSVFFDTKRDTLKMKYFLNKSKTANYVEGQSFALNMLGIVFRDNSLYNEATDAHQEALSLANKVENDNLKVQSLNMLGVVYRRQDLIRAALDHHKQALDIAEAIHSPTNDLKRSIAISRNSMGNIYLALKQYNLALNQFNQSLKIEEALNNKLGLAINYQNIGYAKEALGLLDEALKDYLTSLKYNNAINSEVGRVICFNSIGKIYIKQENFKDAEPIIKQALEKSLTINDQYYIATSYVNLGWLQAKLNQLNLAKHNLNKALIIAEDYNLKSTKAEAHKHLSEAYNEEANFKDALEHYTASITLDQSITNERNIQYVNDLIVKYDTEKKNNEIKSLASENEIVKLKLAQNRKMLLLSALGLLLFAGILFVLYRQRQLKNEKQIITLEQDILRNQMNPHFIFNSLNSIKLYIINNEKENAVYYLNKFSKLIRKILVSTNDKEITLEDELETMALYINIENIRFSNEIKYNVKVDDDVNPKQIKVPSLVLQPFLENSLWHGLSLKETDKQINLHVYKKSNDFVSISILDNGIGRIASQKIKSQKTLKRKSVGISLTKERLLNFSKGLNAMYSINFEDLYLNDEPTGTKVVINIPIKKKTLKTA